MTNDEAMKRARQFLNIIWPYMAPRDGAVAIQIASQEELTRILREIENAAYERAAKIAEDMGRFGISAVSPVIIRNILHQAAFDIRALIQQPAQQKENGK